MIVLLLVLLGQIVPVDLPRKPRYWGYAEEGFIVNLVKETLGRDVYAAAVLALMKCEQGTKRGFKFPDCNCGGMHPWASRYPWGWARYVWSKSRPDGYAFFREGATGLQKPYFTFSNLQDFLYPVYIIVKARGITNGKAYYARWVGKKGDCVIFDKYLRDFYSKLQAVK